jgi:hypothetical protein
MQKMFQGKNVSSSKGKTTVEVKTIIANVNVINVNVVVQVKSQKTRCFKKENQGRIKVLQIGRRRRN